MIKGLQNSETQTPMSKVRDLNDLLFNKSNGLLLSICKNTLYSFTDRVCEKNGMSLLRYYEYTNHLNELFLFAFEEEYVSMELTEKNLFEFHSEVSYFTLLIHLYSTIHLKAMKKEVLTILATMNELDSIDIPLLSSSNYELTFDKIKARKEEKRDIKTIM